MVINPWTLPWPEPLVPASPSELRATFNAAGYNGPDGIPSDIESTVFRSGTPKPEHEQIPGTRFEMVLYRRAGAPIAIVHNTCAQTGDWAVLGAPIRSESLSPAMALSQFGEAREVETPSSR